MRALAKLEHPRSQSFDRIVYGTTLFRQLGQSRTDEHPEPPIKRSNRGLLHATLIPVRRRPVVQPSAPLRQGILGNLRRRLHGR
jgi:hypothetical protein